MLTLFNTETQKDKQNQFSAANTKFKLIMTFSPADSIPSVSTLDKYVTYKPQIYLDRKSTLSYK